MIDIMVNLQNYDGSLTRLYGYALDHVPRNADFVNFGTKDYKVLSVHWTVEPGVKYVSLTVVDPNA
jgi:hypothetical protein